MTRLALLFVCAVAWDEETHSFHHRTHGKTSAGATQYEGSPCIDETHSMGDPIAMQAACKEDLKLCPVTNPFQRVRCIHQHHAELSTGCKALLPHGQEHVTNSMLTNTSSNGRCCRHAASSHNDTQHLLKMQEHEQAMLDECGTDIAAHCPVQDNAFATVHCLHNWTIHSQLKESCKHALSHSPFHGHWRHHHGFRVHKCSHVHANESKEHVSSGSSASDKCAGVVCDGLGDGPCHCDPCKMCTAEIIAEEKQMLNTSDAERHHEHGSAHDNEDFSSPNDKCAGVVCDGLGDGPCHCDPCKMCTAEIITEEGKMMAQRAPAPTTDPLPAAITTSTIMGTAELTLVLLGVDETQVSTNPEKAAIEAGVANTIGEPTENVKLIQIGSTNLDKLDVFQWDGPLHRARSLSAASELTAKFQVTSSTKTASEIKSVAQAASMATFNLNIKAQAEALGVRSTFGSLIILQMPLTDAVPAVEDASATIPLPAAVLAKSSNSGEILVAGASKKDSVPVYLFALVALPVIGVALYCYCRKNQKNKSPTYNSGQHPADFEKPLPIASLDLAPRTAGDCAVKAVAVFDDGRKTVTLGQLDKSLVVMR